MAESVTLPYYLFKNWWNNYSILNTVECKMIMYKYTEIEEEGRHHPPNYLIEGYVNTWDEHIYEVRISEFKNVTSNATYDKIK